MNKILKLLVITLLPVLFLTACSVTEGLYIAKDGTYYRTQSGENHTGFLETDDGMLYFGPDGKMFEEGVITIDGKQYHFFDGKMVADEPTETADPTEPSGEPTSSPSTTPILTPSPSSSPSPESAAVGELTGNSKLDNAVKDIIDQVASPGNTAEKNLGAVFDWMVKELKYKYVSVDLSEGYTEDLVNELAEYVVLNRRGACEHQAALMAVFIQRLGFESIVVKGDFLSDDGTEWVEHGWALGKIDGSYYHFDPLFGRNHTNGKPRTFFMKKDAEIEHLHRWDRDAYPVSD